MNNGDDGSDVVGGLFTFLLLYLMEKFGQFWMPSENCPTLQELQFLPGGGGGVGGGEEQLF